MTYDYIIIGAGASGLLLANAMGKDSFFAERSILLLDKDLDKPNDRTWCFWEKGKGEFDAILHKTWDHILVADGSYSKRMAIDPYKYKMIRAKDFYNTSRTAINGCPNITFLKGKVVGIEERDNQIIVSTDSLTFVGKKVFNSIFDYKPLLQQKKYPVLQQHFIGWFIKSASPIFDSEQATFMDFSIPQIGNTRFMYVLPLSETEALVEYTLFSKNLLSTQEYEEAISNYIKNNLACHHYEILDREKGNIPMSCYDFNIHNSKHLMHIGVAGGWAKPSSGFTFMRTHQKTMALIPFLKENRPLNTFHKKDRFWFYDLLLLDILSRDNSKGRLIFGQLFKNRSPQKIFAFLDEKSTIWQDLSIILACPKKEFIRAFLRRLFLI
ncbi:MULTISPECIES: lycopene cyclase family protein [unclassified Arenibacter]|uniref:lycopene cyclase family protein n=1 Tax=unclassified Arenibacter TaxID=2615047 RepID=UPI000E344A5E|nr:MULTISPECIES: lycopene cyclase family protein [unclassified Arenibacter]MCM4162132.1 lycopene cyclase [Arenibacter sp. A80]RFT57748.1 lycopene cyclase [Arenibacter sp. P308M17]